MFYFIWQPSGDILSDNLQDGYINTFLLQLKIWWHLCRLIYEARAGSSVHSPDNRDFYIWKICLGFVQWISSWHWISKNMFRKIEQQSTILYITILTQATRGLYAFLHDKKSTKPKPLYSFPSTTKVLIMLSNCMFKIRYVFNYPFS